MVGGRKKIGREGWFWIWYKVWNDETRRVASLFKIKKRLQSRKQTEVSYILTGGNYIVAITDSGNSSLKLGTRIIKCGR